MNISFTDLGLKPELLQAVADLGFEKPMPVQARVIPALLHADRDLIAMAQTGTGKTAAFGLPLLHRLDAAVIKPQALVLCPTRELCVQIHNDLVGYAAHLTDTRIVAVYGGASMENQIRALKRGVHVIVATPGRMNDLMERGKVDSSAIATLVLDEADEMLDMGFQDELNAILSRLPEQRRTLLFSATMPKALAGIASNYMQDPEEIVVGTRNAGTDMVEHHFYVVHSRNRYAALKRVVDYYPEIYGIVFCRTRAETREIAEQLIKDGYSADALHGDLSQSQRDQVLKNFRLRNLQLLVATDVAARGLDVDDLSHVINYNLPDEIEVYTHRSGRTGRAGKRGISVSIVTGRERHKIQHLERTVKQDFSYRRVHGAEEICMNQLMRVADRLEKVEVNDEQLAQYLQPVLERLQNMDKDELVRRMVSLEVNRFLEYYADAEDLNEPEHRSAGFDRSGRPGRGGKDFGAPRGGRSERFADSGPRRGKDRGSERPAFSKGGKADKPQMAGDQPAGEVPQHNKREGKFKRDRGSQDMAKFRINLGAMDGLTARALVGLVNEYVGDRAMAIGKVSVQRSYTLFETDRGYREKVLDSFRKKSFGGRRLKVEES